MSCSKFKQNGRGRPGFKKPCITCGVPWQDHPKAEKKAKAGKAEASKVEETPPETSEEETESHEETPEETTPPERATEEQLERVLSMADGDSVIEE